jgi:hypothetical protein
MFDRVAARVLVTLNCVFLDTQGQRNSPPLARLAKTPRRTTLLVTEQIDLGRIVQKPKFLENAFEDLFKGAKA